MKIGSRSTAVTGTPTGIHPLSTELAELASADAAQQFRDFLKGEWITVEYTNRNPTAGLCPPSSP